MHLQVISSVSAITVAALYGFYYYRTKKEAIPKIWRPVGKVVKLHLYPLKSGRRIELTEAECCDFSIKQTKSEEKVYQLHDRSFIIYGENGEFKTARTFPKLMLIEVSVHDEDHVVFDAPDMRSLYVKIPNSETCKSSIIRMHCSEEIFTMDCGDEAASWISRYIYGKTDGARIGFHDASINHSRNLNKVHGAMLKTFKNLTNKSAGLYSDLTAVLLVNEASVNDLNERIPSDDKVAVEYFRPNITIEGPGAPPYVEDDWEWIKIGDNVIFKNVKPCTRCIMTTINPETGLRNKSREPLATLEKYRTLKQIKNIDLSGDSCVMGCNLEVIEKGTIKLNDIVYVV